MSDTGMTTAASHTAAPPTARLRDFPVSFFSTVMGLSGLTLAAQRLEAMRTLPSGTSALLFAATIGVFAILATAYLAKAIRHPDAVLAEWRHPIRICFFPTITISAILLGTAALPVDAELSFLLWTAGAAGHLVLTVMVITAWIEHSRFEVVHMNPAWFIPVVGNILAPLAGLRHAPAELSWFYFSIGMVFWLPLLTIILYRLFFHSPLPGRLAPTLFILLAPPSVGFVSYVGLSGGIDTFARMLYFSAAFFFLLMLPQIRNFARLSFTLSWWAYSFPLAAFTVATLVMGERSGIRLYGWAGMLLFGLTALLVGGLALRTLQGVLRRELCRPEH